MCLRMDDDMISLQEWRLTAVRFLLSFVNFGNRGINSHGGFWVLVLGHGHISTLLPQGKGAIDMHLGLAIPVSEEATASMCRWWCGLTLVLGVMTPPGLELQNRT